MLWSQAEQAIQVSQTQQTNDAMGIQIVWTAENTYLVLDEELDTLNGSGGGLRDGGRDTTHWR